MKLRDELAAHVLERTGCACAVVIVVGGEHNGYGIQAIDGAVDSAALVAALRRVADAFEATSPGASPYHLRSLRAASLPDDEPSVPRRGDRAAQGRQSVKRRIAGHRCPFCGGPAEADCIDNHGKPYKGCSNGCRIKSLKEIEAMCVEAPGEGKEQR